MKFGGGRKKNDWDPVNNPHALRAQQNMKMRALIIISAICRLGLKP